MLEAIESSTLDEAFSELNVSCVLSKVKSGKARRGPGRGYQLSDRFLTSLSAGFPVEFISQAKSFLKNLSSSSIDYSPSIGRGEMACILNEIPRDTIRLQSLVSLVDEETSFESSEYSFPLSISFLPPEFEKRSDSDNQVPNSVKKRLKTGPADAESPNMLTESQQKLLSIIRKGGLFGATKADMKDSSNADSLESDLKFLELSHISRVGFSTVRYVEKPLSENWQIRKDSMCYPAELWYDISAQVVPIFLETALENCVSVIHNHPGIYFSKILKMLPVTTLELVKLLEILLNRGIINKRVLLKPTIQFIGQDKRYDEISSYTLTMDWYKRL